MISFSKFGRHLIILSCRSTAENDLICGLDPCFSLWSKISLPSTLDATTTLSLYFINHCAAPKQSTSFGRWEARDASSLPHSITHLHYQPQEGLLIVIRMARICSTSQQRHLAAKMLVRWVLKGFLANPLEKILKHHNWNTCSIA